MTSVSQQPCWLTHEGHVRASQPCSEVFSVSALWFTPPADLIVTVMAVLTLPPALLSLSFSLLFCVSMSFAFLMCLPSVHISSGSDGAFSIIMTSKIHPLLSMFVLFLCYVWVSLSGHCDTMWWWCYGWLNFSELHFKYFTWWTP